MRAVVSRPRARLALVGAALVFVLVPAAGGAGPASSLRDRAGHLKGANQDLAAQSRSAVLTLYSLDASLDRARARVASLDAQASALARERALTRRHLRIARQSLRAAERELGARLRVLYEQGDTDPLAVLLGATSVDDALATLDNLKFSASADRFAIVHTRAARRRFVRVSRQLATRSGRLERLLADARASEASLVQARAERVAYLSRLAAQRSYNDSQISTLDSRARSIEAQAQQVVLSQPSAPAANGPTPAPGVNGPTMTVEATGYSIHGRTATGAPTGYGVVAVDPGVIPLGTRMTIPGYGEGVAADTGGAIQGARIDLWFPSEAQAESWGRRTVTITLH